MTILQFIFTMHFTVDGTWIVPSWGLLILNATMNILVHASSWIYFHISDEYTAKAGIAGS